MREWQLAQTGLARCSSIRCRIVSWLTSLSSFREGTFGGGGGGGEPSRFSRMNFPRKVGDVLFGYEVTVSTLPFPRRPLRSSFVNVTRRNSVPRTPAIP